jgi:hypothetical protein
VCKLKDHFAIGLGALFDNLYGLAAPLASKKQHTNDGQTMHNNIIGENILHVNYFNKI